MAILSSLTPLLDSQTLNKLFNLLGRYSQTIIILSVIRIPDNHTWIPFLRFSDFKREKYSFSPPFPPCNVVPLFELPIENNKHPNFEWRGQGRGVDSFVLWSYPIWIQCLNKFVAIVVVCFLVLRIVLLCFQSSIDISVRITLRMYTIVTIVSFCQTTHWVEFCSYFFTNLFFYFPIFRVSFATWHPALDKNLSTGQWFTPGIALSNVWTIDLLFFLDEGWCIWRVLYCNYYSGDP